MKRFLALFTAVLLCLTLLSGCGSNDTTPSGGDTPTPPVSPSNTGGSTPTGDITSPAVTDPTVTPTADPTPTPTPEPTPPANLVEYKGPMYHVFYHFLIAFPEIAAKSDYAGSLYADCVTPTEYWRSLEELYKNNFVIYDLNEYIVRNADGTVSNKPIMVPEGKKPLIISFDDMSYYRSNHGKGIADKVIIDENGNYAMYTMPVGATEPLITYDNGTIPLLEKFVAEHPDFSPFGAKGLLAMTGFDGILGYRINRESPNQQSEIEAVKPLVEKLKADGWYFGSHSYGHIRMGSISLDKMKTDTQHWIDEIMSVVGKTDIYVFAFGDYPKSHDDPRFQYMLESGFKIICGVGMGPYFRKYDTYAFMDRAYIDGNSLTNAHGGQHKYLVALMDPYYVYCPEERGGRPMPNAPTNTTQPPSPTPGNPSPPAASPSPTAPPSPDVSPVLPPDDADLPDDEPSPTPPEA